MNLPKFKNQKLFDQAFTHRSYLNEVKPDFKAGKTTTFVSDRSWKKKESNERLEFLGDSILSFVVSSYLFKNYPQFDEGTLTNLRSLLVNTKSLAESASSLEFGKLLKLSKGEEESKGRENQSLLADSFEAFVGALFLDQGMDAVFDFLSETILKKAEVSLKKKTLKDPKSLLQEYVQSQKQSSPFYKVLSEEGPAHARIFTIGVYVSEKLLGTGNGKSKQQAQEQAASEALEKLVK